MTGCPAVLGKMTVVVGGPITVARRIGPVLIDGEIVIAGTDASGCVAIGAVSGAPTGARAESTMACSWLPAACTCSDTCAPTGSVAGVRKVTAPLSVCSVVWPC